MRLAHIYCNRQNGGREIKSTRFHTCHCVCALCPFACVRFSIRSVEHGDGIGANATPMEPLLWIPRLKRNSSELNKITRYTRAQAKRHRRDPVLCFVAANPLIPPPFPRLTEFRLTNNFGRPTFLNNPSFFSTEDGQITPGDWLDVEI